MAAGIYFRTSLTGGGSGALDGIDGVGLANGDMAHVMTSSGYYYVYRLNSTSGATEASPGIISPDNNAGTKRWILVDISYVSLLSANGVKFPSTQVASADANTLDDYEEGSITPVIIGSTDAGTGTYTVQNGIYTKIGNSVVFQLNVGISAHTGTGNISIGTLPVAARNTSGLYQACNIAYVTNLALTAGNYLTAFINPGATAIQLWQCVAGAGGAGAAVPIDTAFTVGVGGIYLV